MALTPYVVFFFNVLLIHGVEQVSGRRGFGPGEQEWGHVTVRPGAHVFWWLFLSDPPQGIHETPLIIWIGSPGMSASGQGNFQQVGPVDVEGNVRNYSWVQDYNVLFIDSPVGTGFSYVDDEILLAKNNREMAIDLLECIKGFLIKFPAFQNVDTYIVSQFYGGKIAAEFALEWYMAQDSGDIRSNLRGVALGDPWISPLDSVQSWGQLLYSVGAVDTQGKKLIEISVRSITKAVAEESWNTAMELLVATGDLLDEILPHKGRYNIRHKMRENRDGEPSVLADFMRHKVATALDVNVTWGKMEDDVFLHLAKDFMKDVTQIVGQLIQQRDIEIFVYNSQLNLMVPFIGTIAWAERIFGIEKFGTATIASLIVDHISQGFSIELENFKIYSLKTTDHHNPRENPGATRKMLEHLVKDKGSLPSGSEE